MKKLELTGSHVYMSPEEIEKRYAFLKTQHSIYLKKFKVQMPSRNTAKALWLVYLYKHIGVLVHKDTISRFCQSVNPSLGQDQQVRHLASSGWYVLNKGEKIPNEPDVVPSGYNVLISTEDAKPSYILASMRRMERIKAETFEELKASYDFRCATCGAKEGGVHDRASKTIISLQQGHMNPLKELTLENTIPQCQLCNQTYKNYFVFDENGRIKAVASYEPVLRADKCVVDEIKRRLNSNN